MARKGQSKRMSALSLQQPNAEQILRGIKKIEYRSRPTSKRERVYIYASLKPAAPAAWKEIGLKPGDLPTGVLVGTLKARSEFKDRAFTYSIGFIRSPPNNSCGTWLNLYIDDDRSRSNTQIMS